MAIYTSRKLHSDPQDNTRENDSTEFLQLKIVTLRLGVINLQVTHCDSGLQLKERIIKKLETSNSLFTSFSNDLNYYQLVRSSTRNSFSDFDTVEKAFVRDKEEFLLLTKKKRNTTSGKSNGSRGPTEKEILTRTKNFPRILSNSTTLTNSFDTGFFQGDLQHDLRKILSEIAKYSACIIGSLPFAEKLIKYYRQKILMKIQNTRDVIKLLANMGFSQENVIRSLRVNGNNYSLALDWLVENVSKQSIEQSSLELSSESIDEPKYGKLYRKTHLSTNSIFHPKHIYVSKRKLFSYLVFKLLLRKKDKCFNRLPVQTFSR